MAHDTLPSETWEWLARASTPTVTTQLFKRGLRRMHLAGVRPVSRGRRLSQRGAAGLVTDGALRDMSAIAEMELPVYAAAASPAMNLTVHHAVDIGLPIGCGGVPVFPGDVLLGDDEAVVVIPRHLAVEVARDAAEQERLETFILGRVEAGAPLPGTYPPSARTLEEYRAWVAAREGRPGSPGPA